MSTTNGINNLPWDHAYQEEPDAYPPNLHDIMHDDSILPLYKEHEESVRDRVGRLAEEVRQDEIGFPITEYPNDHWFYNQPPRARLPYHRRRLLVRMFFHAILSKNDEIVALLIEMGLMTPETTDEHKRTPLLAAVDAGNVRTVQQLMDFGADVNALAVRPVLPPPNRGYAYVPVYRTPLQSAAEKGNLTLVKLLMGTYQADDSIIAPDGQHALRLAAANGYKEIVDYLPVRRGGGWRRWKAKHRNTFIRMKRAAMKICDFFQILFWYAPKMVVWDAPQYFIIWPIIRGAKWLKEHHREVRGLLAKWLMKVPGKIWKVIQRIPVVVTDFLTASWKSIKAIPKATKIALLWLWEGLKSFGTAIQHIVARFFSFLHTVFTSIASFFRNLTLKDALEGLKILLRAIFVDAPKAIRNWLCNFEEMTLKVCKALLGTVGHILWLLARGLVEVFIYVPKKFVTILVGLIQIIWGGYREVMVWLDPKRA
jgi:hypothetical protein